MMDEDSEYRYLIGDIITSKCKTKPFSIDVLNKLASIDKEKDNDTSLKIFSYMITPVESFGNIYLLYQQEDQYLYLFCFDDMKIVNKLFTIMNINIDVKNYSLDYDSEVITEVNGHQLKVVASFKSIMNYKPTTFIVDCETNTVLVMISIDSVFIYDGLADFCNDYTAEYNKSSCWKYVEYENVPSSILPIVTEHLTMLKLSQNT